MREHLERRAPEIVREAYVRPRAVLSLTKDERCELWDEYRLTRFWYPCTSRPRAQIDAYDIIDTERASLDMLGRMAA